jgi:hypothetical protein
MQLKFGRDFLMRPARGSDRNEVVALVQKHGNASLAERMNLDFQHFLNGAELYFQVILNSNGVLIGAIYIEREKLEALAINPNFLRREVRDEVKRVLQEWAKQYSNVLIAAKEMVAGDWKAYFKHNGVKMDSSNPGHEALEFLQ